METEFSPSLMLLYFMSVNFFFSIRGQLHMAHWLDPAFGASGYAP